MLQKRKLLKSKKGFSLPMAMAISVFLVIIATALIFISIQSSSVTSADISGRQAYLNVRSALEYARVYYQQNVDDYTKMQQVTIKSESGKDETVHREYMIMKDVAGQTIGSGQEITVELTNTKADTDAANTFVEATYRPASYDDSNNAQPASLTLDAYSRYSDAFGKKSRMAHLSITFTVGTTGPNRYTVISTRHVETKPVASDSITLHVKKPKGMTEEMVYYVWTYEDRGNAYENYNPSSDDSKNNNSYTYDKTHKSDSGWVSKLNQSTKYSVKPNAEWMTQEMIDDPKYHATEFNLMIGPNGVMSYEGNGWATGEYYITDGRVPWFNIIFAKQNSTLAGWYGAGNIYDTQTNEIFHLWYLDPSDKNIYFEFFDEKKPGGTDPDEGNRSYSAYYTKYYRGYWTEHVDDGNYKRHNLPDWDGKKGLEDTLLVYLKNPKTTIHFRNKQVDATVVDVANSYQANNLKTPVINNVTGVDTSEDSYIYAGKKKESSGITMNYEGCGWWVANVETNDLFDLSVDFGVGSGITVRNISSNTVNNEFWLSYATVGDHNGIVVRDTEAAALNDVGLKEGQYVTVHAKVLREDSYSGSAPKLLYGKNPLTSSAGRTRLLNAIVEAWRLNKEDYTEDSYKGLDTILVEASNMVDNVNFINDQEGDDDDTKISNADKAYDAEVKKIENYIKNDLKPKNITDSDAAAQAKLQELYNDAKAMAVDNKREYGSDYIEAFFKPIYEDPGEDHEKDIPAYYKQAESIISSGGTFSEVKAVIDGLNKDMDKLEEGYLNRTEFDTFVTTCEAINPKYEEYNTKTSVDEFVAALNTAKVIKSLEEVQKNQFDATWADLKDKKKNLDADKKSVLTTDALNAAINAADKLLYTNKSGEHQNTAVKENCTDGTYQALYNAYTEGVTLLTTATTQSEVDEQTQKINKAIDGYTVMKPTDTIAELASKNLRRIWVYYKPDATNIVEKINLKAYSDTDDSTPAMKVDLLKDSSDWGGVLYHLDVDQTIKKINIETHTKNNKTYSFKALRSLDKFETGNILFQVKENGVVSEVNDGATMDTAFIGKLITVVATFDGDVTATFGAEDVPVVVENRTDYLRTSHQMSVIRYVLTDENKNNELVIKVKTRDPADPTKDIVNEYNIGKLDVNKNSGGIPALGEYVVVPDGDTGYVLYKSSEILPRYPKDYVEAAPENPETSPTAADTDLTDSDIGYLIADEELEVMNVIDRNKDVIYFTDSKWDNRKWGENTYAYFYNDSNEVGNSWPGQKMSAYIINGDGNTVYMTVPPSQAKYVIFNENGKNDDSQQSADGTIFKLGKGYSKGLYNQEQSDSKHRKVFNVDEWSAEVFETKYIYIKTTSTDALSIYFTDSKGGTGFQLLGSDKAYPLDDYTTEGSTRIYKFQPPKGAQNFVIKKSDKESSKISVELDKTFEVTIHGDSVKVSKVDTSGGGSGDGGGLEIDESHKIYVGATDFSKITIQYQESGGSNIGSKDAVKVGYQTIDGVKYAIYSFGKANSSSHFRAMGNYNSSTLTDPAPYNDSGHIFIMESNGSGGYKLRETNVKFNPDPDEPVVTEPYAGGDGPTTETTVLTEDEKKKKINEATPLEMAYVGGFKVRITNESYSTIFTNGQKEASNYLVFMTNNKSWGSQKAHFWKAGGSDYDTWPGVGGGYVYTNSDHQDVYSFNLPQEADRVIFSNNGADQTTETVVSNGDAFWIDGNVATKWTIDWKESKISSSNLFGGSAGNDGSDNRLGMAALSPYYDWYEYKIPVSSLNQYYFSIQGLKNGTDTKTMIVDNAYGNVWLTLNSKTTKNDSKLGNVYTDFSVYTYDPDDEENDTDETISVFYKKPDKWTNVQLEASGFYEKDNKTKTYTMTEYNSGRSEDANVVYCNIPKGLPFIKFTADENYTVEGVSMIRKHEHIVELQGGDKMMFVPSEKSYVEDPSNPGSYVVADSGEWVTKVSEYRRFTANLAALRSRYYSSNIVSQYDDNGELADGAIRYYSTSLKERLDNYVKPDSPLGACVLKDYSDKINDPGFCKIESDKIETDLSLYGALYAQINEARQYIASPLKQSDMPSGYSGKINHGSGGGVYPQYLNRVSADKQYTSTSIQNLKERLGYAEGVFVDGGAVVAAINGVKAAISSLTTKSEGSIAIVLYDSQRKVKQGSSFKIQYRYTNALGKKVLSEKIPVKEYNPEGYPIIFLDQSDIGSGNSIDEVCFFEVTRDDIDGDGFQLQKNKTEMKMNEAWVFIYTEKNPTWSHNSTVDYHEISADKFSEATSGSATFMMPGNNESDREERTPPYKPMVLLFNKDTTVESSAGNYTIKAGSYTFTNADVPEAGKVKEGSPLNSNAEINLYTAGAKAYFENNKNIGIYESGQKDLRGKSVTTAVDVSKNWIVPVDSDDLTKGYKFATAGSVIVPGGTPDYANFDFNKSNFGTMISDTNTTKVSMVNYSAKYTRYEFNAKQGISFRWSCESPLYTSAEVRLCADEIIFGTMGTIDGTKTYGAHFYLGNYGAQTCVVDFRTDVIVNYVDLMGELHTFAIREGKYRLKRSKDATNNFVADLYDETYWKGMECVEYLGKANINDSGSGSSGTLQHGTFGN